MDLRTQLIEEKIFKFILQIENFLLEKLGETPCIIRNFPDFNCRSTIELLHYTFVRSGFEYVCLIWTPCPKHNTLKMAFETYNKTVE